jgi:protein O-GlcNAc transferase
MHLSNARVRFDSCPLCGHSSIPVFKIGDCSRHPNYHPDIPATMTWVRCARCRHVFTDGYFTEEAIQLVFSKTLSYQTLGDQLLEQRPVSARMIEKVIPYQASGRWMDLGVGNGSLLFTAEEYGFSVVGIDLRRANVETLRGLGYEAYCTDFQQFHQHGSFNVISLADVLEHMPYPLQALKHVHKLLADGGIVFLSMPNSECMGWRMMDLHNLNPYWGELEHYHNFSRGRLYELLLETGFRPLRYGISERYKVCMEVIAVKPGTTGSDSIASVEHGSPAS